MAAPTRICSWKSPFLCFAHFPFLCSLPSPFITREDRRVQLKIENQTPQSNHHAQPRKLEDNPENNTSKQRKKRGKSVREMDSLLIRSGLHGLGSSITVSSALDARPGPTQLSSIGRSSPAVTNAISVAKGGSDKISSFSFSAFNYPFRSLFFGGGNKQSPNGVALDDAVLLEKEERNASTSLDESDGQNGNWVLKIHHVNSLWLSQKQGNAGGEEGESEGQNGNCPPSSSSSSSCSDDNEEGGGCSVCDDDERGKLEFDTDSFSKLLKKVSLAEARLYAQMSYLGSLAYEIPKIKVLLFLIQLFS